MLRVIIMAVLGTYAVLVATTSATHQDLTPLEKLLKQQVGNNGFESKIIQLFQTAMKTGGKVAGPVPWRCFAKKQDLRCSGTILTDSYVLVKSSCMKAGSSDRIEVHAGASNGNSAQQIVGASILNLADTPAGIVVLKLDKKLSLNRKVMTVKLTNTVPDEKLGLVSGFRYNNGGTYTSEFYAAAIFDNTCGQGKLCGYGNNNWPMLTNDLSKSTDFLDYFDQGGKKFYFVGVLEKHYGQTVGSYYKVKDMIPWLQKHVPGITVESVSFSSFRNSNNFIAHSDAQLDNHL